MSYPVTIVMDRYTGVYSGAEWLAFPCHEFQVAERYAGHDADNVTCRLFWDDERATDRVGRGATPDAAYADMQRRERVLR